MDDVALGRLAADTEEHLLGAPLTSPRTAAARGAALRPHLFEAPASTPRARILDIYLRLRAANPSYQTAHTAAQMLARIAASLALTTP